MHSPCENENIPMWRKHISPLQKKLLPFLPGSLLKYWSKWTSLNFAIYILVSRGSIYKEIPRFEVRARHCHVGPNCFLHLHLPPPIFLVPFFTFYNVWKELEKPSKKLHVIKWLTTMFCLLRLWEGIKPVYPTQAEGYETLLASLSDTHQYYRM